MQDKLYQINHISFFYMTMEASETDLSIVDVPENEVWSIDAFKNYNVKLINNGGQAEVIDFSKYRNIK